MLRNFDQNELTVITTVVGLAFSIFLSWFFYWLGKRSASREREQLIGELRTVIRGYVQGQVADLRSARTGQPAAADLVRAGAAAPPPAGPADGVQGPADDAVTEIVRGYLALLVNERGDVDKAALWHQVSEALGPQRSQIWPALTQLSTAGVISVPAGEDIRTTRTVHVNPVRLARTDPQ